MAHAHMPEELEQLNPVALQEFTARAAEGPVVMLNLLDFKPAGGAERYREYGKAVAHLRTEALERSELHPLDPADPAREVAG
jgi:hypothetical protein